MCLRKRTHKLEVNSDTGTLKINGHNRLSTFSDAAVSFRNTANDKQLKRWISVTEDNTIQIMTPAKDFQKIGNTPISINSVILKTSEKRKMPPNLEVPLFEASDGENISINYLTKQQAIEPEKVIEQLYSVVKDVYTAKCPSQAIKINSNIGIAVNTRHLEEGNRYSKKLRFSNDGEASIKHHGVTKLVARSKTKAGKKTCSSRHTSQVTVTCKPKPRQRRKKKWSHKVARPATTKISSASKRCIQKSGRISLIKETHENVVSFLRERSTHKKSKRKMKVTSKRKRSFKRYLKRILISIFPRGRFQMSEITVKVMDDFLYGFCERFIGEMRTLTNNKRNFRRCTGISRLLCCTHLLLPPTLARQAIKIGQYALAYRSRKNC